MTTEKQTPEALAAEIKRLAHINELALTHSAQAALHAAIDRLAALASAQAQQEPQRLDFSQPLETEDGQPVTHICHDVVEFKCARICVDQQTGIVYSSPYVGLKIRNTAPPVQQAMRPDPCPDIKGFVSGGGLDHVMSKVRAGVVPGWKLVPVEPTQAMLEACQSVEPVKVFAPGTLLAEADAINNRLFYRAILAAAPPAPEAVVKESLTTPEKREPLTVITLPDGAELRNTDHYGWRLYREGRDIRLLDYWEQTFINAAIHAAHGVPPAIEKHSRLTDQKINDAIRDGGIVSCDDATWAFRAGVEFAEDFHGITPVDAKEGE